MRRERNLHALASNANANLCVTDVGFGASDLVCQEYLVELAADYRQLAHRAGDPGGCFPV